MFITALSPDVEELMLEGFLLQVTLPETEQLYRYLTYKLTPPPSHCSPSGRGAEQSPRRSPQHNKVNPVGGFKPNTYFTHKYVRNVIQHDEFRFVFWM